ncbi:MAG: class I SAM-dependent methyltransferase [Pseudomonadota bacterium]
MAEESLKSQQDANKAAINALDADEIDSNPHRQGFFDAVYENADTDPAMVPWADLAPKSQIADWISNNPGHGKRAIDVACGLGDHAEALSDAGYQTTAFDFSQKAIDWAQKRFPGSTVDYRWGDLMNLPDEWLGTFDLVNECYTVQSVPPPVHADIVRSIVSLLRPGGTLLVYTRTRDEGTTHDGPPWPLMPSEIQFFTDAGLNVVTNLSFNVERPGRSIPHRFLCLAKE